MGKIDDPHRPKGQRKADRNEVKNCTNRKPIDNGIDHLLTASSLHRPKRALPLYEISQTTLNISPNTLAEPKGDNQERES